MGRVVRRRRVFLGRWRPWISLAPGPDQQGRALSPRARRSEFRFPTEPPGSPSATRDGGGRSVPAGRQVEVDEHEQIVERVAAIDVAKASGMVCTRVPHPTTAGKRLTRVWEVAATTNAIIALADQLAGQGIERVVV